MKLLRLLLHLSIVLTLVSCNKVDEKESLIKEDVKITKEDSLEVEMYINKASNYLLNTEKRQFYLDSTFSIKEDIAELLQQKAMLLYKSRKYSLGKPFLAKAVFYNPKKYLDYSAFMKCIFSKEYNESIIEFMEYKERFGDSHVMDHTYDFYLGLCYLQLNEFEKANVFLQNSVAQELKSFSEDYISSTDWFYLGVSYYELKNYKEAIKNFDNALKQYPVFSDAQYYKYQCLKKLNKFEEAKLLIADAYANSINGNTINEANSIYEKYPYQVFKGQLEYLLESDK